MMWAWGTWWDSTARADWHLEVWHQAPATAVRASTVEYRLPAGDVRDGPAPAEPTPRDRVLERCSADVYLDCLRGMASGDGRLALHSAAGHRTHPSRGRQPEHLRGTCWE